jgi:histidinol dehydrogenase
LHPPGSDGQVDASIRFVLAALGLRTAFRVGGAQAIAALTYGTESIPAVDKIFGPGNQYVTMAKQLAAMRGVSIDMPAGPSEVAIIADAGADADFIAADLLSQAEHGPDSQVILLTWAEDLPEKVDAAIARYLPQLPRHEITAAALRHARIVVLRERDLCIAFANEYAAEHLIINCEEASAIAAQINHAGSVFVGRNTPEAAGDYASGTNHTLPTGGYARSLSGVGLESFSKYITFQEITPAGVYDLGPVIETMARAEQLQAHALAMRLRRDKLEAK